MVNAESSLSPTEANLWSGEAQFKSLVDNIQGVVYRCLCDRDWTMLFISDYISELCGYPASDFIHSQVRTFTSLLHPEDAPRIDQEIRQAIATQQPYRLEYRLLHADGSLRWVFEKGRGVWNSQGELLWLDGVILDITERKLSEEALKCSEAQLRQQTEQLENVLYSLQTTQAQLVQTEKMSSLGQLLAGVAHEINNPVNFIYGNLSHASNYTQDLLHLVELYQEHYPAPVAEIAEEAEAIDLEFLMEDLPKLLRSMRVGAERIQKIVLCLRNFSRADESEKAAIDIHEGIDSTLMILQNRLKGKAGATSVEVVKDYGDLPLVECFGGQLNQVFMNILANAIDALEEAEEERSADSPPMQKVIRIQTTLEDDQAVIRIADNGPGIPEDVQERLFHPFFTTKPVGKGTGLGLSISHEIITETHGGTLTCLSELGQGTEFYIELPIKSP